MADRPPVFASTPGGGYGKPGGRGALPFLTPVQGNDKKVVIAYQIGVTDPTAVEAISREVARIFAKANLPQYDIVPVLIPKDATMSVTDTEALAKHLVPTILRLLQIPNYESRR